jgi:hypothetical protein
MYGGSGLQLAAPGCPVRRLTNAAGNEDGGPCCIILYAPVVGRGQPAQNLPFLLLHLDLVLGVGHCVLCAYLGQLVLQAGGRWRQVEQARAGSGGVAERAARRAGRQGGQTSQHRRQALLSAYP